jgi:uncharacterized protein
MGNRALIHELERLARFPSHLHGPAHWARVQRFGALLAEREGLSVEARRVVDLFAWTHDLAREDDWGGNAHALAGAEYLDEIVPVVFPGADAAEVEVVRIAIRHHSDGLTARQALEAGLFSGLPWPSELAASAVGVAWDADRLDLLRLRVSPRPELMSTTSWRDVQRLAAEMHHFALDTSDAVPLSGYDVSLAAQQKSVELQKTEPVAVEVRAPRPKRDETP